MSGGRKLTAGKRYGKAAAHELVKNNAYNLLRPVLCGIYLQINKAAVRVVYVIQALIPLGVFSIAHTGKCAYLFYIAALALGDYYTYDAAEADLAERNLNRYLYDYD